MQALRVGDPRDECTELGPLARKSVMTDLHDQVQQSVAAGARVLTGGAPLDRPGCYIRERGLRRRILAVVEKGFQRRQIAT